MKDVETMLMVMVETVKKLFETNSNSHSNRFTAGTDLLANTFSPFDQWQALEGDISRVLLCRPVVLATTKFIMCNNNIN